MGSIGYTSNIHQVIEKKHKNEYSGDIPFDELIKASVQSHYKSKTKNVTINIGDVMNSYWEGYL